MKLFQCSMSLKKYTKRSRNFDHKNYCTITHIFHSFHLEPFKCFYCVRTAYKNTFGMFENAHENTTTFNAFAAMFLEREKTV